MKSLWVFLKELILHSPWKDKPYEAIYVSSYMEIFCSTIALMTALAILIEIRKGPWFVTQVIVAIITASSASLFLNIGYVLNWYNSHISHTIGIFLFCLY